MFLLFFGVSLIIVNGLMDTMLMLGSELLVVMNELVYR